MTLPWEPGILILPILQINKLRLGREIRHQRALATERQTQGTGCSFSPCAPLGLCSKHGGGQLAAHSIEFHGFVHVFNKHLLHAYRG